MRWLRPSLLFFGFLVLSPSTHVAPPLVVHEWGTITTRHAPNGTPQGRLNRIDTADVVPAFVHRYEPPSTQADSQRSLTKTTGTPGRPDVTMRLETPVIYFYPPAGSGSLPPFDVSVRFRGGIVNEFYPTAQASVELDVERVDEKVRAGLIKDWDGAVLDNYVVGGLRWRDLSLSPSVPLPATESHVWLAPRRVRSSGVATAAGEGERYLFYRGVAHLSALMQTELTATDVRLRAPARLQWLRSPRLSIPHVWLVSVRPGGRAAFQERTSLEIARRAPSAELTRLRLFPTGEHRPSGLRDLRASMKAALTEAGLFDDEADAMLETWRDSYFSAPGLRLLYIVPSEWAAYFLPLQISVPHRLTRVLVGRIDLLPG